MKTTLKLLLLYGAMALFTIAESAKSDTGYINTTAKRFVGTNLQYLRLKLAKDPITTEDIVVMFKNSASEKYTTNEDAPYLQGFGGVHLYSFSSDSIPLAINVLPLPGKKPEIIRLDVMSKSDGVFTLNMNTINNIPVLYDIWLIDKYQNDSLDMRKHPVYSFNISQQDTLSFGSNRFALIVRQDTAYQYRLLGFTATKNADTRQVQINWTSKNEGNNTEFTVERSINGGRDFAPLDSMLSTGAGTYVCTDKNPLPGGNTYRLKQADTDRTVTYSNTLDVFFPYPDRSANNVNIYPNPVNNTINLTTVQSAAGNGSFNIEFMDGSGRVVKEVLSGQLPWQGSIAGLKPGPYFVRILNSNSNALVGETRFVKL